MLLCAIDVCLCASRLQYFIQRYRLTSGRPVFSQGVRAVLAVSFDRVHRSNLVSMGVLPLQYLPGQSAAQLGLTGRETFTISLPRPLVAPRPSVTVKVSHRRLRCGEGCSETGVVYYE